MSHTLKESTAGLMRDASDAKVSLDDLISLLEHHQERVDALIDHVKDIASQPYLVYADITEDTDPLEAYAWGRCAFAREILDMIDSQD